MAPELRKLITDYIELINANDFVTLYKLLGLNGSNQWAIPYITQCLMKSGIEPTLYMKNIPALYCKGNDAICDDNIKFNEQCEVIGRQGFAYCDHIEVLDLPHSLETICSGAFEFCNELREVHLYDGLIDIQEAAFYNCRKLERVYYHGDIEDLTFVNIANDAFKYSPVKVITCDTGGDFDLMSRRSIFDDDQEVNFL